MRLLIISHTPHYFENGTIVGLGSTVREIDQLASLFSEVVHLAPLHNSKAPSGFIAYQSDEVRTVLVRPAGGEKLMEKALYLSRLPSWLALMRKEIKNADVIHVRCPAVVSLVGLIACGLWADKKPCWVKYAGNWLGRKNEPLTYIWQRRILMRPHSNRVVTINGRWQNQPSHVFSFYNPSYSSSELEQACCNAETKQLSEPLRLLFVGRLDDAKGVGTILQILRGLLDLGVDTQLVLVGDSPQRAFFEQRANSLGLQERVFFLGWKDKSELAQEYAKAHFILLPSVSEGWPKVLSEAMAYGVVPLASDVSSIPQIFKETGAGHAFPAEETRLFVDQILQYTQDRSSWKEASKIAVEAADRFTYETYLEAVKNLFYKRWKVELNAEG